MAIFGSFMVKKGVILRSFLLILGRSLAKRDETGQSSLQHSIAGSIIGPIL